MAQQRYSGYASGSPLQTLAPLPFSTNDILGSNDFAFPFGQMAYQTTNKQVVFYAGKGNWIPLGGGSASIDTINNIGPTIGGNFSINGTANQIAVTGGTNSIALSLIGPFTPSSFIAHTVLLGEGSSSIGTAGPGTDGQTLIGNTGADPSFASIGTKSGLTSNGVILGGGAGAFTATPSATNANILVGGSPPAFGQTVNNANNTPIVFNGAVSMNRANVTTFNGSTENFPWMLYGEVPVPSLTPATYYIASSSSVGGIFYIYWVPESSANRNHTATITWDAIQFDDMMQLNVLSNNSYVGQDVFTNFRDIKDTSGLQLHYLAVDVGNLNGVTGFISVIWVGNPAEGTSIIINPGAPATPINSNIYGFYQNTNGLLNYFGGQGASTTNPGGYPYGVLFTDYTIAVDTAAPRTINLPASPMSGEIHIIKDITGSAGANNITVAGNGHNIDGAATKTIASNFGSMSVQYNSTSNVWMII